MMKILLSFLFLLTITAAALQNNDDSVHDRREQVPKRSLSEASCNKSTSGIKGLISCIGFTRNGSVSVRGDGGCMDFKKDDSLNLTELEMTFHSTGPRYNPIHDRFCDMVIILTNGSIQVLQGRMYRVASLLRMSLTNKPAKVSSSGLIFHFIQWHLLNSQSWEKLIGDLVVTYAHSLKLHPENFYNIRYTTTSTSDTNLLELFDQGMYFRNIFYFNKSASSLKIDPDLYNETPVDWMSDVSVNGTSIMDKDLSNYDPSADIFKDEIDLGKPVIRVI